MALIRKLYLRLCNVYRKLNLIVEVAVKLGADASSKRKLVLSGFWLYWNNVRRKPYAFTARLEKFGQSFSFQFENVGDYGTLHGIFVQDEYQIDLPEDPDIILDLGSYVGLSLVYFRLRYPRAKLYGFEPDPNNYQRLEDNVRQLRNVQVLNTAVSSFDGKITLFVNPYRGYSSSVFQRQSGQETVEVETKKLDTLVSELGVDQVDLLKFDIEGAEMEVFRSFRQMDLVTTYIGEAHPALGGWRMQDFVSLFDGYEIEFDETKPQSRYLFVARKKNHDA